MKRIREIGLHDRIYVGSPIFSYVFGYRLLFFVYLHRDNSIKLQI